MWNPNQYERFKQQRSKPFYDLRGLVEKDGVRTAVDLGCGTGELTRQLFDHLRLEETLGIDSSSEMLGQSAQWSRPGLRFEQCDIAQFRPAKPVDLVFSNAAIHWLPDHESLLPRLLGWVRHGGQVAIQMPFNFDHPSHVIARETAAALFPAQFANKAFSSTLTLERYAQILFANGFAESICRVEVYGHPMASGRDVIEWTRGTLLTAYEARLGKDDYARFLDAYRTRLLAVIGEGAYFYAFKRLLLWGRASLPARDVVR